MTVITPFDTLAKVAEDINMASEHLQEALREIDTRLAALHVGVEVWLDEAVTFENSTWRIGYGRTRHGWGLRILRRLDDNGSVGYPILLTNASRVERIQSVLYIPRVLHALEVAAQSVTEHLKHAFTVTARIVDSLPPKA